MSQIGDEKIQDLKKISDLKKNDPLSNYSKWIDGMIFRQMTGKYKS